jgi:hypothetical protein
MKHNIKHATILFDLSLKNTKIDSIQKTEFQ